METKSVSGAAGGASGGGGGQLCHLCGYKYASAHPSAKHRRAHKKNCGGSGGGAKSPPATAAAATAEADEERQGKKLLPDACEGEAGGGNGAGAPDSGGGLPGSAEDAGNAAEGGDNGVHSSPSSAEVQVIINDDVTSQVDPKANGTEVQTEVAVQVTENAPHLEDLHTSESSHVSGDETQDGSASHRQSEPEVGAKFSPDISADETSKSNGVALAPNGAAGEISAETTDTVGCPDDIAATEKDCAINNIEEDKASEDMLVKGSEIVEGLSAATIEKDLCVNDLGAVSIEQIPSVETESKKESGVIGTDSVEQAFTDKQVHTDTSGDDLSEHESGGCHLEEADVVKTQQETDPASVVAEQLTNSKQTDLEEGQSYPDADEVIQAAWNATGPADSIGDLTTENLSEVTTEDDIQSNSNHTSGTIPVPSQIDLVEPTSDPTSYEINIISREDSDEAGPNENIRADLTSRDRTEPQSMDTEETALHETKAVCGTDNIEESKQIEEITAEVSPLKSSILPSLEEKELIEEVNVICSRDIVVEKEQSDVCVGSAQEINMVNIPANVEFKTQNDETTTYPTACETDITNITGSVEEKKQNEETTTDPAPRAISVIHSPSNDDKMQNEGMSEVPSSHENAVMDGADIVQEKDEEPMSDSTSNNMDAVSAGVVQGKKQEEEATVEPTSGINVVHTIDSVKEKESEEPASSFKIDAGSNADSILAVNPPSHENNTSKGTDDAGEKNQDEKVHADDNIQVAQTTDGVAEKEHKDENTTREIKTTESANGDQNEEITDKEMTIDSDKSHVSLKSLLSEKGMEATKEKKASTKDRVLSFRRRSSKDNPSPGKPGSVEQDWNSPARLLPVEKSPKGKKQPWMPFICCHSMN